MRNTFNQLLVILAVLDNLFLVLSLLDHSLARVFGLPSPGSELYALVFPCIVHPLTSTTLTAQTFLIVVIAFERSVS